MSTDSKRSILSGIKYHDYMLLVAHMDAEKLSISKRTEDAMFAFTGAGKVFSKHCSSIRENLEGSLQDYRDICKLGEELDVASAFDPFLYNPAHFVAFGNSDNISIVAVDEFESAASLSSLEDVSVRQTCLAFCPELKSLGLGVAEYKDIFCDMREICQDPYLHFKHGSPEECLASPKEFFKKRPLVAVNYFKLNGMSVLGPGLFMQEYAYKVMARRIKDVLHDLSSNVEKFSDIFPGGLKDIESFRCLFLDPQGWSDIATLMFCRNYSVIAAVMAALRSLTLDDLYGMFEKEDEVGGQDPERVTLKDAVDCFGIHEAISNKVGNSAVGDTLLGKNHLFCSTFTNCGMYDKAFAINDAPKEEEDYHYSGTVIGDTHLSVCAGHFQDVKCKAENREKMILGYKPNPKDLNHEYVWYILGHSDFLYQQFADKKRDIGNATSIRYLIHQIKEIRSVSGTDGVRQDYLAVDMQEVCTHLRIPFPILPEAMRKMQPNRHIEMRSLLHNLCQHVFKDSELMNLKDLTDSIRILRIPSPLSSSIRYLYSDFCNYLSDPFLSDSVLDLYDIFKALHRLLTHDLRNSLRGKLVARLERVLGSEAIIEGDLEDELFADRQENLKNVYEEHSQLRGQLDGICLTFLDKDDLDSLVELVEVMQNAISNRVQITFREAERWNATVDVRGIGLDRIVSAADVPLKCGLGILRRVMNDITKGKSDTSGKSDREINAENRMRIGGTSKISCHPRSFSKRLVVGEGTGVFLASVDLDIASLTRPRNFYIHLHETAHLISYLLRDKQGCLHEKQYECAIAGKCCHKKTRFVRDERNEVYLERYQEIFAEMFVHQFVFENDHELYLRNFVTSYSLDTIVFSKNANETFIRMLDTLIRGFLASEPYRKPEVYSGEGIHGLTDEVQKEALDRFWKTLDGIGVFLFEFQSLWHGAKESEIRDYVNREFLRVFQELHHPVCCIWEDVRKIYAIVSKETYPDVNDIKQNKNKSGLIDQIKQGLDTGRPLVRVKYKKRKSGKSSEGERLDSMLLITQLLRNYLGLLIGDVNTKEYDMYLQRGTNGKPDPRGKKYYRRALDRNFNGIVAVDPEVRKQSLRSRIVIIKTLWDISTTFRARRMKSILESMPPDALKGD